MVRTEYDGGGRVIGQTDANGNTAQYQYDKLGRKVAVVQPNPGGYAAATSTTPDSGYDPMGDLSYVANPTTPVSVSHPSFHRAKRGCEQLCL